MTDQFAEEIKFRINEAEKKKKVYDKVMFYSLVIYFAAWLAWLVPSWILTMESWIMITIFVIASPIQIIAAIFYLFYYIKSKYSIGDISDMAWPPKP